MALSIKSTKDVYPRTTRLASPSSSALEPCCWRRAVPWVRARLSGLGAGCPELHPAPGAGLPHVHASALLPCGGGTAGAGPLLLTPLPPADAPLVLSPSSAQAGAAAETPGSPAGLPAPQPACAPGGPAARARGRGVGRVGTTWALLRGP